MVERVQTYKQDSQHKDKEQLAALERVIEKVPADDNCLFESVARQLARTSKTFYTQKKLRHLTYHYGRANFQHYRKLFAGSDQEFVEQLKQLEKDKVWSLNMDDFVFRIISDALQIRIAVIRSHNNPQYFPESETTVYKDTVVVVHDERQNHYDSTVLKALSMRTQLNSLNRTLAIPRKNGNSFLSSISHQINMAEYHPLFLRYHIYFHIKKRLPAYLKYQPNLTTNQILDKLEELDDSVIWKTPFRDMVLSALHESLGIRFVVLRNGEKPVMFPTDSGMGTGNEIILVESVDRPHYDSTVKAAGLPNTGAIVSEKHHRRLYSIIGETGNEYEFVPDDFSQKNSLAQNADEMKERYGSIPPSVGRTERIYESPSNSTRAISTASINTVHSKQRLKSSKHSISSPMRNSTINSAYSRAADQISIKTVKNLNTEYESFDGLDESVAIPSNPEKQESLQKNATNEKKSKKHSSISIPSIEGEPVLQRMKDILSTQSKRKVMMYDERKSVDIPGGVLSKPSQTMQRQVPSEISITQQRPLPPTPEKLLAQEPYSEADSFNDSPERLNLEIQLRLANRLLVNVKDNGASFLITISHQINIVQLHPMFLRYHIYFHVKKNLPRYLKYQPNLTANQILDQLEDLNDYIVWKTPFRDMALDALQESLGVRFVVITDGKKPAMFPPEPRLITGNEIILVESVDHPHYNSATKSADILDKEMADGNDLEPRYDHFPHYVNIAESKNQYISLLHGLDQMTNTYKSLSYPARASSAKDQNSFNFFKRTLPAFENGLKNRKTTFENILSERLTNAVADKQKKSATYYEKMDENSYETVEISSA